MKKMKLHLLLVSALSLSNINAMEAAPLFDQEAYNQTKKAVLEKFPTAMGSGRMDGAKKIDQEAIALYRAAFAAIEKESDEFDEMALAEHFDVLIPIAQKALGYATRLQETFPTLSFLTKEINYRLESNNITPNWLSCLGLRLQAGISTPSEEEKDIFAHTPNPSEKFIKSLYHRSAWKNHLKTLQALKAFKEKNHLYLMTHYEFPHSDYKSIKQHLSSLNKELPEAIYYPLFFTGGLDFSYIAENIFDEVYPIAHSLNDQKGHGVTMSPISFTIHDYLHAELDPRRPALITFFLNELDKQIGLGDITLKSAPIIIAYTKKLYSLYKDSFKQLLHLYFKKLATDENLPEFQRAMAAIHHLFHESTSLSPKVFEESNFENVLRLIMEQKPLSDSEKSSNDDVFSWDSPTDPFITSPVDGSSSLTDGGMITELKALVNRAHKLPDTTPFTIKESKRFIDVTLTTERGKELHYSLPTLFHKWNNADDYISLLDYAGTKLEKPQLEGLSLRLQREQAINLLTTIQKEVNILSQDFFEASVDLSSISDESNGMSLKEAYALAFHNLKRDYEAQLSTVKRIETQAMIKQKELEQQLKEENMKSDEIINAAIEKELS